MFEPTTTGEILTEAGNNLDRTPTVVADSGVEVRRLKKAETKGSASVEWTWTHEVCPSVRISRQVAASFETVEDRTGRT